MTDFEAIFRCLADNAVEFVVVGGAAAVAHGSARVTQDVDIVYARSPTNITRLVAALADLNPRLRGAPPGLPFRLDERTVRRGLNFTLVTDLGDLDLLGEITGGGGYDELEPHVVSLRLGSLDLPCLDLPTLIRVKRAAGRPKDFEAIAELEALLEERDR